MSRVTDLSREEARRYARQITLPNVGAEGQRRLKHARVLLVGAGGLGSPAALYLAAAGVGTLGLVDFDVVDASNLHRQILHGTAAIGTPKLDSARARLADVNPHVCVETHETRLTSANAMEILRDYDVVVDGTDNFATRYLVNDACVLLGKPNVHGAIFQFEGQASVFCTPDGPCYRCLFPEPPPPGLVPSCAEGGVLGVLPGLVGTIQATETLKLVLGLGDPLVGRLLLVDALGMSFRTVRVPRDPACRACGTREITTLIDYDAYCGTPMPNQDDDALEITPQELAARRAAGADLDLIDVREPHEWAEGRIAGARHIPLGTLAGAIPSIDGSREVVVYCRSGVRSLHAVHQLRAAGIPAVSLAGGILRWEDDVGVG
ncbi:molybdopterin-synthase adenylyltransferase MoeB [Gemmatirosa kalamazoonensis]|uniref:molybdopterin-synthase adenylyltransferase MoeB n=1 Tax=Gemmatirosa kalamazoonensis TaxID=861299 RepID=UPI00046D5039